MSEDINRLPKWAQERIAHLLHRNQQLAGAIRWQTGEDPSPVTWQVGIGERHNLPEHASVRFELGTGHVDVGLTADGLRVATDLQLVVLPMASNCVYLEARS